MVQPFDGQGVNYMRENMEYNPWMSQMSQQHGGWHSGDQWGQGNDWNQNYGHMQHQQHGNWNMGHHGGHGGHGSHGSHGYPMHHGYHQSYPWQSSQQHWRPTQQHWQTYPMHHDGHHQQWQQWNPGHPWM